MRAAGAGFLLGSIAAFVLALRVPPLEYRGADFQRPGISHAYAERQAARTNRVAVLLRRGAVLPEIVLALEAAFAVPWYQGGRGPGEDSLPLRKRTEPLVSFIARDPNSPWYRRSIRAMRYDADFVGRRGVAYRNRDGRELSAGELVEERTGVTFRVPSAERSAELFSDALARLEAARTVEPEDVRRELASALRALALAMPYGERSPAFAEALVLGAHLAIVDETFRLNRDVRSEFDRAAWTAFDDEDFARETGFELPSEKRPPRALSQEDSGA